MKQILFLIITAFLIAPLTGFVPAIGGLVTLGAVSYAFTKDKPGLALMAIPVQQAMGVFTQTFVKLYREDIPVKKFLQSFFPANFSTSKFIQIGVKRGTEYVAADVKRYSDGNRNKFTKASLKTFLPPYFHEYLDLSDHHLYDDMIESLASGNTNMAMNLARQMATDFVELRKKIERAVELQAAQVIQTGVVTLASGDDIDFKRKAASLVAYSAAIDFSIGTVDPAAVLTTGCEFIRTEGKSDGAIFNCILGDEAYSALINNTLIKSRNDIKMYSLDQIQSPTMSNEGAAFHGELSCGSYKVRLWTYPENYESALGTYTNYINSKKVVLLPVEPFGTTEYALVPQLPMENRLPQTGQYLIQEEFKEIQGIHRMHIKSAPLAVPYAVDKMWTATVLN